VVTTKEFEMAQYDLGELTPERCATNDTPGVVARSMQMVRLWLLRRRTAAALGKLDEHLLCDAGFEQADSYDPLNGGTAALWKRASLLAPIPLPSTRQPSPVRPTIFKGEDAHDKRRRFYDLVHGGSGTGSRLRSYQ
jgi:uncharacterized protein YjiS (DUF1127 family)